MAYAGFRRLTDRQLRRQARLDAQFAARAQARIINQQARAGERNAAGIAEALARAQSGYGAQMADIYGRAQHTLGDLAGAQRQALGQAGGGTLAEGLQKRLALGGQSSDLSNALAGATAGAAGAGYGGATAELGALAQRQAAAEEFGAKLPQLARLTGLQGVQDRQAQAQADLGKLRMQQAQAVTQLISQGRNRQFNEGAANLAYTGKQQQEEGRNARAAAQLTIAQQKANEAARHNRNLERIAQQGGDTSAARAAEQRRHNKWLEKHPGAKSGTGGGVDVVASRARHVLVNKKGKVIKDYRGKPIPWKEKYAGGTGGGGSGL